MVLTYKQPLTEPTVNVDRRMARTGNLLHPSFDPIHITPSTSSNAGGPWVISSQFPAPNVSAEHLSKDEMYYTVNVLQRFNWRLFGKKQTLKSKLFEVQFSVPVTLFRHCPCWFIS
ncbi:hypothetical protein KY289_016450 [Solanum tuberosum]|nr:hypothetical protein KY289_016450 [Solanum tuberosum]